MNRVEKIVTELAEPIVAAQGCALWAVEYVKEGARWVLRVLIDHEGGVSTAPCEAISRLLDPLLDERDPIPGAYVLEVSSAGLERPLKRPEDFSRCLGRQVLVRLYTARQGAREFTGALRAYDGNTLTLEGYPPTVMREHSSLSSKTSSAAECMTFLMKDLALARLYVSW